MHGEEACRWKLNTTTLTNCGLFVMFPFSPGLQDFRHDRDLLKDLCRIAHACLLEYLRATLDLPERILRHLGLWEQGVRVLPARAPPEIAEWVIEPCYDDPFPDYDAEPVMAYANG